MFASRQVSGPRVAENLATVSAQQRHYESAALVARDTAGTVPDARMKRFGGEYLALQAIY